MDAAVIEPALDRLAWRALTPADVPALTRLWAESEAVDGTGEHYGEEDVAELLADPALDLARDTLAAQAPDGRLLAAGLVRSPSTVRDVDRVHLEGTVHPAVRGRGLGRRLLGWQEERGAELHRERHPQVPGELTVDAYEKLTGTVALVRAAGFTPVRWFDDMQRPLDGELPAPPPVPAGVRVVLFDRAYDEAVRLAHVDAFAGHWGSVPTDPQRWAHWFTGAQAFRPELSLLALTGEDEVAGYLLSYFFAADAEAHGVREAWIGQLGTRAAWRRRGLGTLLLATVLRTYRDAGYQRAALDVDTGNTAGALRLYERLGFVTTRRSVTSVKPIG